MADVRALLKAKRQEVRISHPYASYNTSGQLKCSICATVIKHASAWEGHLGSKAHRTNVLRLRDEEKRQHEIQQQQTMQQDDEEDDTMDEHEEVAVTDERPGVAGKRKATSDESTADHAGKKRKVDKPPSALPADFFSDPSLAPVLLSDGSDDEGDEAQVPLPAPTAQTEVDLEYEKFQRELMGPPKGDDVKERYDRATVAAEAVVASNNDTTGFPPANGDVAMDGSAEPTEEELRRKKEEEERELIMDRLLEEERAQEDADTRVLLLKNKIELLRQKKREARAKKEQKGN